MSNAFLDGTELTSIVRIKHDFTGFRWILLATKSGKITDAQSLREVLLQDLLEKQSPSNLAISYIKEEVSQLW